MAKITKLIRCAHCREAMEVGADFKWVDSTRWATSYSRGAQGVYKVPCRRPAHTFDCVLVQMKRARELEAIEIEALALEIGATPEQIARLREVVLNK